MTARHYAGNTLRHDTIDNPAKGLSKTATKITPWREEKLEKWLRVSGPMPIAMDSGNGKCGEVEEHLEGQGIRGGQQSEN